MQVVQHAPGAGARLIGTPLPHWPALRELMEVKAACFYPIRLVGWDVALTPGGPVVLEGNFWFDPPNTTASARACIENARAAR
jgi:hypothetical protein